MNLIYEGNVDITIKYKSQRKKNKGTNNLFRLFSAIITGEPVNSLSCPYYLYLFNKSASYIIENPNLSPELEQFSLLRITPQLHRYTLELANQYSAVFDTTILSDHISLNRVVEDETITLALVSQNKSSILAAVPFDYDFYQLLEKGHSAVVRWTMTLRNLETDENKEDIII